MRLSRPARAQNATGIGQISSPEYSDIGEGDKTFQYSQIP